jgi:hypothetical protein
LSETAATGPEWQEGESMVDKPLKMLYRASRSFVMLYRMFDICFDKLYDVLIRDPMRIENEIHKK